MTARELIEQLVAALRGHGPPNETRRFNHDHRHCEQCQAVAAYEAWKAGQSRPLPAPENFIGPPLAIVEMGYGGMHMKWLTSQPPLGVKLYVVTGTNTRDAGPTPFRSRITDRSREK